MDLNMYKDGKELDPLTYSNGKDQTDVVKEILEAFDKSDTVWLDGKVGSGKSALGIRTAIEMGGGTISVPTKVLSDQYYDDYYVGDKYFIDGNGNKVEIAVFKGRNNFICPYMRMKNPHLDDDDWRLKANNRSLPCTERIGENESREGHLSECPWGGMIKKDILFEDTHGAFTFVESYVGLGNYGTVMLKDKSGSTCPYWSQYKFYPYADIIAMNSQKFKIETWIERLPKKPLVIIDEADTFLDGLCSKVILSKKKLESLYREVKNNIDNKSKTKIVISEIKRLWENIKSDDIHPFDAVEGFTDVLEDLEWEIRLYHNLNRIQMFRDQCTFENKMDDDDNPKLVFYLANPKPILNRLMNNLQAKILFMSATKMDRDVWNDMFGIDPVVIKGEPDFPGTLVERRTGDEMKVNYDNWNRDDFVNDYNVTRNNILDRMARPGFVPVHSFKYLPSEVDPNELSNNNSVEMDGVEFSTKMDRGSDLGDKESVTILKYPYPSTQDPLMKAIKKKLGESMFWEYYRDLSRREFIQQIGRIMRSRDARKEFWSPDLKCHKKLKENWEGDIETL